MPTAMSQMRLRSVFVQGRRRRFFDDLLKAALDRTLAIKQMHDIAVRVAQYLHLDVARALDIALDIKPPVAEIARAFAARAHDLVVERRRLAHDPHALAAAAGRRLDQERKAHRPRAFRKGPGIVVFDGRRRDRKAARRNKSAGAHLVAHELDGVGGGADEDQARLRHLAGEVCILGQEAIAWMDRAGAACARRGDDLRAVEIGCDRRRAGDLDRAICGPNSRRARVGGVMHHDRFQSQRLHGAQNAQRDLAAIGNQNALERPAAARIGTNF